MAIIDNLKDEINILFKEKNVPPINSDFDELEALYDASVKNVWTQRRLTAREQILDELNPLFLPYLGNKRIWELFEEKFFQYNQILPPEIEVNDTYDSCLKDYHFFIKMFTESEIFFFFLLRKILYKISLLVSRDKSSLITILNYNQEKYQYQIYHGVNTTILSIIAGNYLGFNETEIQELGMAGLLHDLGMLKIPQNILNKEEKLTSEEYELIKSHTIVIYKLLMEKSSLTKETLDAVLQHHEQVDGLGYPKKLKQEQINIYAKILAVADAIDSQISSRSYSRQKTGYMAMKDVLSFSDNRFDSKVLKAFLSSLSIYPPGTLIQLNNNVVGVVYSVNIDSPLKPVIRVIIDEFGDKVVSMKMLDLKPVPNIYIVRVINPDEYKK